MFEEKSSKIWVRAILLAVVAVVAVVGGAYGLGFLNVAQEATPQVLRVAIIPAEDIEAMIMAFEPVRQYLERELGLPVEIYKTTDYTAAVEAMRAGKADIAHFGPFSFVLAAERANARAIVARGADGRVGVYHSVLITHRASGLTNMEDVKRRVGELIIGFVDPASTSGYLVPEGYLRSIGIGADSFKEAVFAGGHDTSLLAVAAQRVDLGSTTAARVRRARETGIITEDVIELWRSEGIANPPIAVRGDLDEALILRIQQAFLDLPTKDPVAFESWTDGTDVYVKVTNEDFEYVRMLAESLGKLR